MQYTDKWGGWALNFMPLNSSNKVFYIFHDHVPRISKLFQGFTNRVFQSPILPMFRRDKGALHITAHGNYDIHFGGDVFQ